MITNKYNLPEALVRAVMRHDYDAGGSDITVTQLVAPPQLVELTRLHAHEIIEDAADCIWRLLGSIAHGVLERADIADALTEERLFTTVAGWKVSGALDRTILLPDATLQDYKLTSVYAAKDEAKTEWSAQLNLLRWLLVLHSFRPEKLEIVAILRDWRPGEAKRNPDWYSPAPAKVMPVDLWDTKKAEEYLYERVTLHQQARGAKDLPPCTSAERWAQPGKVAVYKGDNKRATRLFDTEGGAQRFADELVSTAPKKITTRIEVRPAVQARCQSYCAVSGWCSQWAALKPAEPAAEEEEVA